MNALASAGCVRCGTPFPPNHEIASLPDAARIAFDAGHRRVWRLCASCGAWNLLGPEAASRSIDEVRLRYEMAPRSYLGDLGIAAASPGLEIIRVDETRPAEESDQPLFARRRQLLTTAAVRYGAMGIFWLWVASRGGASGGLADMALIAATWFGFASTVSALRPLYFRHRVDWVRVIAGLGIFAAASIVGFLGKETFSALSYAVFWGALLVAVPLLPVRAVSRRLTNGKKLKLDAEEVVDISMAWDASGQISLHGLPRGASLTGEDAMSVLRPLLESLEKTHAVPTPAGSERALALVRAVGGLQGVLGMLEGHRADQGGRVTLATLPPMYLIALDLALSQGSLAADRQQLRGDAREAAGIALEAERLDAPG